MMSFTDCDKGIVVSLRRAKVGPASLAPTLARLELTKNLFLHNYSEFDCGVIGELLGSLPDEYIVQENIVRLLDK